MRLVISVVFAAMIWLTGDPVDWQGWLNKGIEAYKSARYQEAAEAFQKAVELNPSGVQPHLYLASAWMAQYVPGADSPENAEMAAKAEVEFKRALELNPNNETALESLASLSYQRAAGITDVEQKMGRLDEARSWYERVTTVNPRNKEAWYSMGVIAWAKWYPRIAATRAHLGMRPEDPGPLPNAAVRQELRDNYWAAVEDGISNLKKALDIDPTYDDAMAYLNLLYRERADLRDTAEEYRQDVEVADGWLQKALESRKSKATTASGASLMAPPLAPPPPPPAGQQAGRVQRIRVGGNVQEYKLARKVDPVYPPLAKAARIQGVVRFTVIIGKDGRVAQVQLVSGHPLLVQAAMDAVREYVYRPTLLNGEPVEVITTVEVKFFLDSGKKPGRASVPVLQPGPDHS